MSDPHAASPAGNNPLIPVSPDNPCPFLRGLVAGGYVDGHVAPLPKLTGKIESASGTTGLKEKFVGAETYMVALSANGLSPLRLLRSWWSGAVLDELRNGPLDKRGAGSRILEVDGQVDEPEIARLAEFGSDYTDDSGGSERGLNSQQITTYMNANFERAKGHRRAIDRLLMNGEWPVLLNIMGKGDGDDRYLSVAEVRTLFVERTFPARIVARLAAGPVPPSRLLKIAGRLIAASAAAIVLAIIAITQFPDQLRWLLTKLPGQAELLAELLPPPLPDMPAIKSAHWLDQNWSTEDRHWFHHASQGTKTFPVHYAWFVALEQPRIHLFSRPALLSDTDYLERFGFIPDAKTIHTDKATLLNHGYADSADAPASTPSLSSQWPAENPDGLPVGFARMAGATNPATGVAQPDLIGLTCAACHTGSIHYKGTSIRYDGGPAMVNLLSLEKATGLSIIYTLSPLLPLRFDRFAKRVLGPNASKADRAALKKGLLDAKVVVEAQATALENLYDRVHQQDTVEGYGRLDALNRIGNQVFATDPALSGVAGFEDNLHVRDAPVSFPPIWTVSWFYWAQYDASIQQPLIRNAGEALGVSALLNISPDYDPETLFRSSVDVENLAAIETLLKGPNPFEQTPKGFAGLRSPKWPAQMFPDDDAWQIKPARVESGRKIYAEICVECHLGPVNDPVFDKEYPDKSFWSSNESHWKQDEDGPVLDEVQKGVGGMGTDPAQAHVLTLRTVKIPGFIDLDPARDLKKFWGCTDVPVSSTADMPFSLALMDVVDLTIRKSMDDKNLLETERQKLWGSRKNCPNPGNAQETHYRVRPLNGVWATAPYLHNGSVPSLYWMLKPAAERPKQFCMGTRDFDPQQVGFRVEAGEKQSCRHGETLFSTVDSKGLPITGNSNLGHSLEGTPGPGKPGVIGRMLSEDERTDLIEYLKTL
ncbi:MAG: di-heme-cytochrome C peroxidase [Bradyrhizobium sp.]|uniref:di-heme-cytochrome C peroxidase n=1 Tax=Bradyrhizobium sp. TaxID=376 RepID=UPI003C73A233